MSTDAGRDYFVGFDLGGTKMLAEVFDSTFAVVGRKRKRTRGNEGVEEGLKRICATIEGALEDAGIASEQLAGIGVGCPGPLDLDAGLILDTPNLGWQNVPVRKALMDVFGCSTYIVNDVDAGVYGEYSLGAAQGAHCVLGVFPGTGIGGGCVYEGKLLRGKTSSVMEIGHVQVVERGPLCGCGRQGCLEAVASRLAIASAAVAAAYRGEAPYLLEKVGTSVADVRSGVLAASLEAGDESVAKILKQAARWIGVAVGNVVNLLGPDVVVLGGGLVEAMPEFFCTHVAKAARKRAMPSFEDSFRVVAAKLGDDATAAGAAAWARNLVAEGH